MSKVCKGAPCQLCSDYQSGLAYGPQRANTFEMKEAAN